MSDFVRFVRMGKSLTIRLRPGFALLARSGGIVRGGEVRWGELGDGGGIGDLVADSERRYVEIEVEMAQDVERLMKLRNELRERMPRSSLANARSFTRRLESAYCGMCSK
jgi:hypothetical protein